MVTPKNNLPPESQQWRRDIERRLASLELVASNLSTATKSSDIRLGSLNHAMRSLDDTVQRLSDTVTTVNATVASLDNQIHFSSETPSYYSDTLTTSFTETLPFDPELDQEVAITVPEGVGPVNAVVWFGSWMTQSATTPSSTVFGDLTTSLELTDPLGVTTQVYFETLAISSFGYDAQDQLKASAPSIVMLSAGTHVFRTRRAYDYTRYSSSVVDISYQTYPIVVLLQFALGA